MLNNDWVPNGGLENFGSSFLPASHQATMMRAKGVPVDNIAPADRPAVQHRKLALLAEQDGAFAAQLGRDRRSRGPSRNYETAFRMQTAVPELADVSREPEHDPRDCTASTRRTNTSVLRHAGACARGGWSRRGCGSSRSPARASTATTRRGTSTASSRSTTRRTPAITEQSVAALIIDLKQRGLLDETIVLWAGEMGRTPHTPKVSADCGRDHHVNGYSIFMAGGGFKGASRSARPTSSATRRSSNPLTVHDIHATILHQLGLDHSELTFRHGGRDQRLTDVHGQRAERAVGLSSNVEKLICIIDPTRASRAGSESRDSRSLCMQPKKFHVLT